jgi:hypothetical protein
MAVHVASREADFKISVRCRRGLVSELRTAA